ncbi:MAG: glycerate-2-kinase family protein, partial [Candidatus Thiodiazotropha sp. (ex Lucinoma borealis)]|nr:glycerate-2-kinase family protein [Candidatus Thiodiazotropha sp. (ex Lucinoma borealis)]
MHQQHLNAHYRKLLIEIYQAALVRVEGRSAVSNWMKQNALPDSVRLIAIGKAAQSMARGASDYLGDRINQALIISKSGHVDHHFCRQLGWVAHEAAHPVPDETTLHAGQKLLDFLADGSDLPLLFLISGGASSLVEVPVEGVDIAFLTRTNDWLLGSGLDILQMNWIRKGLSQIKGGGLIRYLGGRETIGLAISDVPGDDPAVIGSGLL